MSDTPSHAPVKSIMPKWIRGPQDFVGGVALMAIALFALWASSDLQGMHGFSFGPGRRCITSIRLHQSGHSMYGGFPCEETPVDTHLSN